MVNFFLPAKGSTASWDPYRRWIFIWRNLFGLHLCTEFQLANCACASGWSCLMNLDLQESNGRFRVAGLVHWSGGAYCVTKHSIQYLFFYGFYFVIGVKAEFMQSTVQCFFLAIIVKWCLWLVLGEKFSSVFLILSHCLNNTVQDQQIRKWFSNIAATKKCAYIGCWKCSWIKVHMANWKHPTDQRTWVTFMQIGSLETPSWYESKMKDTPPSVLRLEISCSSAY